MSIQIRFKRRNAAGAAGAPTGLLTAEPAYNMADGILYVGFGDDGSGNATSVKAIGADDFVGNVPAGGTSNQILAKSSNADGEWIWVDPPSAGEFYSASEDGITLSSNIFSLNYTQIATGLNLSSYALSTDLDSKADASHTHDASEITSGVLDVARIPVLPGNQTVVSSGSLADLTAAQESSIEEGTIVATTDGNRYVYSGSGDRTLAASYVALADTTPEWSVIADKPAFAAVATSGSYADLTSLPTLGTMASQDADNVAITGGTIEGVVLDGGTF